MWWEGTKRWTLSLRDFWDSFLRSCLLIGPMSCVTPEPLCAPGLSRFSHDSDGSFLSLNGITLVWGGGGLGFPADHIRNGSLCCVFPPHFRSQSPAAPGLWSSLRLHPPASLLTDQLIFLILTSSIPAASSAHVHNPHNSRVSVFSGFRVVLLVQADVCWDYVN